MIKSSSVVLCVFSVVFSAPSCTFNRQDDELEPALRLAGDNRNELERLLAHYRERLEDSLEYRAACFLIANMPYYHYYEGKLLDDYSGICETLATSVQTPQEILDSYVREHGYFSISRLQKKQDIRTIKASYLINNIDWAFRVWRSQPWGKSIGFDDFCEYILPYRVGDEQPAEWRQMLYEKYNPLLDSLRNSPGASDPYMAVYTVIQSLCREEKHFTATLPGLPHLGPHVCERWRAGSCRELADLTVYILRALGIACGVDYLPVLSRADSWHEWVFILDQSGRTYTSDYLECKVLPSEQVIHLTPKIYRRTFSVNREMKKRMHALESSVPPYFTNPRCVDVTSLYPANNPIRTITVTNAEWYRPKKSGKIAYLCVPRKQDWQPVAWAAFDKNKVQFEYVKSNTLFKVATWEKGQLVFQTDPFIVDTDGNKHFVRAGERTEQVCLFSKYNCAVEHFTDRMMGGIIEGSNRSSFIPADTLFVIEEEPIRMLNRGRIYSGKKYQYIRYKGKDGSYCDIAEVAFFSNTNDTVFLSGKVIGSPNLLGEYDHNDYVNALDGDPYTSFHYRNPSGGWVGLELEQPVAISKVVYTPRNRDNFIRKGDLYELFYMDKDWRSLGRKTAVTDSLVYDRVPAGALLFLKNHTRGVEERPFLYENGKQLWW